MGDKTFGMLVSRFYTVQLHDNWHCFLKAYDYNTTEHKYIFKVVSNVRRTMKDEWYSKEIIDGNNHFEPISKANYELAELLYG